MIRTLQVHALGYGSAAGWHGAACHSLETAGIAANAAFGSKPTLVAAVTRSARHAFARARSASRTR